MSVLIYLHGFLSSPLSAKAQQTASWLKANRPDIRYHCPYLSSYPGEARATLDRLVQSLGSEPVGLIGSSLGGFWATYLAERYNFPAVLVNPAVRPQDRFDEFVGQPLKNYHSDDSYCLTADDLQQLVQADAEQLNNRDNYWVMLQTGDETLDYRLAVEKYQGCKFLVEEGGSHTFEGYQNWIPQIVEFLFDQ